MRTGQGGGFKIGELDSEETQRAHELVEIMSNIAESHVTTNLFGDRWSRLAVNSMANPIAGLSGYGSNEFGRSTCRAASRSRWPPRRSRSVGRPATRSSR